MEEKQCSVEVDRNIKNIVKAVGTLQSIWNFKECLKHSGGALWRVCKTAKAGWNTLSILEY